ncbi:fibro-slime domain-containing protein [Nannocystaceae bacterium ST9]
MRRGALFTFFTSCALALACGDNNSEGGDQASGETAESGTGQGTDDEIGTEQGDTNGTTGDGDGDSSTGDGDGDTNTTASDTTASDTTTSDTTASDTTASDTTASDTATDTTASDTATETTATTGDACGTTLFSTVRDFQIAHPDFEYTIGVDLGIVQNTLGMDEKPVYAGNPVTPTTTGAANFNQWYNDVNGVNQAFDVPIELVEIQPGLYQYSNGDFFPIDGQGWGNEGNTHNYHFTLELHSSFQYFGGEVFGFEGDDDLWVFVNNQLGINLGGVHGPMSGQIDMDALAGQLGIQIGGVYDLDFFFAERHTSQSNFEITTTIACFDPQ